MGAGLGLTVAQRLVRDNGGVDHHSTEVRQWCGIFIETAIAP